MFITSVPPYGQEDLQDLRSIFEITHLRDQALFLDTQCMCTFFPLFFPVKLNKCYRPYAPPDWALHI